ncbi:hypothetical protein [Streptomyces sporangiiformans]|uniref:Uncharacterized protein n=1 Tax=Streptomyces sporangiiformans TaxID=2315329 RepID=A0A505DRH2_9ACTN|nr:hypothetical protein [Streptomyces sporangiiformans]TPQ23743.1 hypothetical protein FGD71_002440 [Streptomyces sporangiiformans]
MTPTNDPSSADPLSSIPRAARLVEAFRDALLRKMVQAPTSARQRPGNLPLCPKSPEPRWR